MGPQRRVAVVATSNKAILRQELAGQVREKGVLDSGHPVFTKKYNSRITALSKLCSCNSVNKAYGQLHSRALSLRSLVNHRDTSIVADPGQLVSRGRKGDVMDPATYQEGISVANLHARKHPYFFYPPPLLENSAMQFPKVIFFPQQVEAGFSSISFTYVEKTLENDVMCYINHRDDGNK